MSRERLFCALLLAVLVSKLRCDEDLKDFDFADSDAGEVMIAQESRHYQTFVKSPVRIVKPTGVTNSHRPQYNLDSLEDDELFEGLDDVLETTTRKAVSYKPSYKLRSKESMIKDAVLRALERKDHVGKFAQLLPIIRAMSGNQRVALASLVASQVTTPPGRAPLNLAQVRSMFGNNVNTTTDLMLPILLDMANLIRRAVRPGKQLREVKYPPPPQQMLRRSFTEDVTYIDDDIELDPETNTNEQTDNITSKSEHNNANHQVTNKITTPMPLHLRFRTRRILPLRTNKPTISNKPVQDHNRTTTHDSKQKENNTLISHSEVDKNVSTTIEASTSSRGRSAFKTFADNTTDLTAAATNQTLAQDLPVAEKLRAFNRYIDRKSNLIRRGTYPPKPPLARHTTAESTVSPVVSRRRPAPPRKLPSAAADQAKCELFTNTLCLHADDYPTEAIVQSIRRNKAAAGALLADFKDPGESAVDGVTAAQEAKYTAEHYLVSNRRGDTANRDFAGAGEAGFMCPSTVKYARPQRARATSGQWKYIVNTGEHTQTLRLEKCLKPKESCTYLTDNFKSKCVQVYNYHRLLTWDQQNGLHMDIFKVPTCCSCHIEGYSVSFPPLGHRVHETSSEQFPSEDLSSEHGNQAFESVQSTIHRPSVSKSPPFTHTKPLETFPPFSDNHNLISGVPFSNGKHSDNEELNSGNIPPTNPMDSYGNTYFHDSFNQASSVRNIKRPLSSRIPGSLNNFETVTLPSYLEPPTPSAPNSFTFLNETPNKYKITGSQFKRGPIRPNRRPIRKKISGGPEDLISSGTSAVESLSDSPLETMEDFSEDLEELEIGQGTLKTNAPKRVTIAPKLQAVTPETISSTYRSEEPNVNKEIFTSNGKRVNYNYHPIIDFFDQDEKGNENDSIDREDSEHTYVANVQSEWKPINHPSSKSNVQSQNIKRKKH